MTARRGSRISSTGAGRDVSSRWQLESAEQPQHGVVCCGGLGKLSGDYQWQWQSSFRLNSKHRKDALTRLRFLPFCKLLTTGHPHLGKDTTAISATQKSCAGIALSQSIAATCTRIRRRCHGSCVLSCKVKVVYLRVAVLSHAVCHDCGLQAISFSFL